MYDDKHAHAHSRNRFSVIPTAQKLDADARLTGRGITIAFLDSGFYPHPDFADRVIAFHDVSGEETELIGIEPKGHHWHGTQTATACAGSGLLSDGIFKGLAHESKLVLVKVSRRGRIGDEEIIAGLKWIAANRERLGIRILNMSLGGDTDAMTAESEINRLAEMIVADGVVVTVAAGNAGDTHSIPPANAPSVITVGGYSDSNHLDPREIALYHSNFGETLDGNVKPEIIAPAMFVAAPILPETDDYRAAETLSLLADSPDYAFKAMLDEYLETSGLTADVLELGVDEARKIVEYQLHRRKIVGTHYQHVDGTSFAAPITASVAAQMLEANPKLTPHAVKHLLVSTASRITGFEAIRQGFGMLNAAGATAEARKEVHRLDDMNLRRPEIDADGIVFFHHDDQARRIALAGDFNDWDSETDMFAQGADGVWRAKIAALPAGEYRYKFVVDGTVWVEDPSNLMKRSDDFGGFNSILKVVE